MRAPLKKILSAIVLGKSNAKKDEDFPDIEELPENKWYDANDQEECPPCAKLIRPDSRRRLSMMLNFASGANRGEVVWSIVCVLGKRVGFRILEAKLHQLW